MSMSGSIYGVSGNSSLGTMIDQLMALERQSLNNLLLQRTEIESKRASISTVTSLLSTLQSKMADLSNLAGVSPMYKFLAKTSDGDKVTATAGGGSLAGSYEIEVAQLAAAHGMASNEYVEENSDFSSGTYAFDLTVGGTTTRIDVDVDEGDNNSKVLDAVAAAINNSDAEVLASVMITDEAEGKAKLVIRSRDAGIANSIDSITDVTGNLATTLNFAQSQAAKNALINVDGVDVISSSNTVEGVIPGVTLNLLAAREAVGEKVTIDVSGDTAGIRAALEAFIAAYNSAATEVRSNARGEFRGDPVITGLPALMMRSLAPQVQGLGDTKPSTLLELGISFNGDGTLEITNTPRLNDAIEQFDVAELARIFNAEGEEDPENSENTSGATWGIGHRLEYLLGQFLGAPQDIGGYEVAGPLSQVKIQLDTRDDYLDRRIEHEEERLSKYEYALAQKFTRIQDLVSQVAAQNSLVNNIYASVLGNMTGGTQM